MNPVKLFCIPHAGSTAMGYYSLQKLFAPYIKLCPLELGGRGRLIEQPLRENLMEIVDDIYAVIINQIDDSEYAILGHSLGGIIAYELCYKLEQNKHRPPSNLFVSGRRPPHMNARNRFIHELSDEELCKEVLKLQGTSIEVFEDKNLSKIFLPIIRADFKAIETYQYTKKKEKLDCDITVLCGTKDNETKYNLSEWADYTNGKCEVYKFKGNHFFLYQNKEVINLINETVSNEK